MTTLKSSPQTVHNVWNTVILCHVVHSELRCKWELIIIFNILEPSMCRIDHKWIDTITVDDKIAPEETVSSLTIPTPVSVGG